ncbi:hypothetical protein [Corynebacterium sp.]|uniref:hypothetical protein n=1 Tax=Corynebacterium sp. TaxID=1720 RepID=UPI002647BC14|nr:hypothetical protein [Corynebacterium sp.]MDN6404489.1 hypothetical protein [Corynebacterium sp.]
MASPITRESDVPSPSTSPLSDSPLSSRALAAPALILTLAVVLRGWQLSQRTFYWDDLVIPARFRDAGLWVPYDGHLMPGSGALQIVADTLAPLQWWLPVVITLVATVAAGVLWWLVLGQLTRAPWVRLLGFTALVFSPFLGIASGWWSAGVNALSWQLTAGAVALLLLRPRVTWKHTLAASAVLLVGLLMTEKVLTVVPALIAVGIILRLGGRRLPALPWLAPTAITAGWAGLYLYLAGRMSPGSGPALDDLTGAMGAAVLPGALGGPWTWDRWNSSPAFPTTPGAVQAVLAGVLLAAVVALVVANRRRPVPVGAALLLSVGYLATVLLLLQSGRSGDGATDLLARGMHYYVDWWSVTVLALVAAVSVPVPARGPASGTGTDSDVDIDANSGADTDAEAGRPAGGALRPVSPVLLTLAVLLVCSSTASTLTWVAAWSDDLSAKYLATLREATADPERPLLDQNLPLALLTPLVTPYNSASHVAGGQGGVSDVVDNPQIITPDGELVEGHVLDASRSEAGEEPQCGVRVEVGQPRIIRVEPPLPLGDWTWEFTATATEEVDVELSMPNGLEEESQWRARTLTVPVDDSLTTRWVNMSGGGGGTLMANVVGPTGAHICIGAGAMGPLIPR